MKESYILAIDQGTTGTTALLIDHEGRVAGRAYSEITQYYPKPGWVEHDPKEIWQKTLSVADAVLRSGDVQRDQIVAIGITNQRETSVVWDRRSGEPVHNAIVWQCRRTAGMCEDLRERGLTEKVKCKTGLVIDPYFSATKLAWILDNVEDMRDAAQHGHILFGTIDTWLLWKLTNGKVHATDYTNASRTMLFNIHSLAWDEELLAELDIPMTMLPEVRPSSGHFGEVSCGSSALDGVPIAGDAGDQQAALFGQACFHPGSIKNTYGTGCFLMLNTGEKPIFSQHGLLTTLACGTGGPPVYAIEGSVFITGAAVQWLRDGLKIINSAAETESLAESVSDTGGVYVVPAFTGLGAPYWDADARGAILGITRGTGREHIVRATLESIAYQTADVMEAMRSDFGDGLSSHSATQRRKITNYTNERMGWTQEGTEVMESSHSATQRRKTTNHTNEQMARMGWTQERMEAMESSHSATQRRKITNHPNERMARIGWTQERTEAMESSHSATRELRVDGGAAANNFLMQFQSDVLGVEVNRPAVNETTALGAAFLAGLAVGFWEDESQLERCRKTDAIFKPKLSPEQQAKLLSGWREAVRKVIYKG